MFVEACDALAQTYEAEGRPDLAALCDRAAFWLDDRAIGSLTLDELRALCAEHPTAADQEPQEIGRALASLDGLLDEPDGTVGGAVNFRTLSVVAEWLLGGSR